MRVRISRVVIALLVLLLSLLATSSTVVAQDYVTTTWTNLRQRPSMSGAKLRVLHPSDTLNKRTVPPRVGWLPVRTQDGLAGWVSEPKLRDLHKVAAASETTVTPIMPGSPATRIDAAWTKPTIDTASIRVRGNTATCGPFGDLVDDGTNFHKNRVDLPTVSHAITVDAIRSLPDTALWRFTNRKHWTSADSSLVVPYEGIPVTVEGYFEIVKAQATSAPTGTKRVGESPNCHSWAEEDTDWHMALVADPSETEDRSVVVEPTPRTKRNNLGWTPARAQALAVRRTASSPRNEAAAARVRVTGFLMLDPVHPAHIRGKCKSGCDAKRFFRATLWEVHPVTRIEVLRNGAWVDLNDL